MLPSQVLLGNSCSVFPNECSTFAQLGSNRGTGAKGSLFLEGGGGFNNGPVEENTCGLGRAKPSARAARATFPGGWGGGGGWHARLHSSFFGSRGCHASFVAALCRVAARGRSAGGNGPQVTPRDARRAAACGSTPVPTCREVPRAAADEGRRRDRFSRSRGHGVDSRGTHAVNAAAPVLGYVPSQ
eukprot:364148-Chlamydomonas_euryale.AAC.4